MIIFFFDFSLQKFSFASEDEDFFFCYSLNTEQIKKNSIKLLENRQ